MKLLTPGSLCLVFVYVSVSNLLAQVNRIDRKVNGISLWTDTRTCTSLDFLESSNASWVSFQPYGVIKSDSTGVVFDKEEGWKCSSYSKLKNNIALAKSQNYQVFVKPHLVLDYEKSGAWVGDLKLDSEVKWQILENSYRSYVLSLAHIADSMEVELFSLGTELGTFPLEREQFWSGLIDSVKTIYTGPIIYCANFDEYEIFPFWDKMDYVGIDSYFTLDTAQTPSIDDCMRSWRPIKEQIKQFSKDRNKYILFTEYGYRSADYCAYKPFGANSDQVNLVAQANGYRALFYAFWDETWFRGGFSWVWHFDNDQPENYDNILYTPQNKPAERIIAKNYGRFDQSK